MKSVRTGYTLVMSLLAASLYAQPGSPSGSQTGVYYETTQAGETSICAFQSVILYAAPGQNSSRAGTVLYSELLEHLGQEAFVRNENSNYLYVRNREGRNGWINESYIIRNGGAVVLLRDSRIYGKPATATSATTQLFKAGEILILSDFQNNWSYVTGVQKEKSGWIEGYENLSVEASDLEIAATYNRAMAITDLNMRRTELQRIGNMRGFMGSEMARIVKASLEQTYAQRPQPTPAEAYLNNIQPGGEDLNASHISQLSSAANSRIQPTAAAATPAQPAVITPTTSLEEVFNPSTGVYYYRVTETGAVQPVKAQKPKNIYYAYHKSLPIGTKVLLEIPGKRGYVELEVIARLKDNNPSVVGLGPEVMRDVFGVTQASEIVTATILYPQP
ncbi:MAG: SH3 domain-containing protein [Bacteroidia bacterium]|nr:SH3 domain-containing protein [Bacteroidia bacterium]